MGFLLDKLDIAKLNAQREVVKNERRQGVRQSTIWSRERDLCGRDVSEGPSLFVAGDRFNDRSQCGI